MPITRLLALFLYGTFAAVIAVTRFTEFFEDDNLGDFTCPTDHIDFAEENKGSLEQCLLKCSKASTCYGVFRHVGDMRCVGCQDKFLTRVKLLTDAGAPLLKGTRYYRRPVYRVVTKGMNWYGAKNHCEGLGGYLGYLADIKSREEEEFIYNYVLPGGVKYFWIGATNLNSTESFLWQDGTKVPEGYNNWYPQEPDYMPEHCTAFDDFNRKWTDWPCAVWFFLSLCEFD